MAIFFIHWQLRERKSQEERKRRDPQIRSIVCTRCLILSHIVVDYQKNMPLSYLNADVNCLKDHFSPNVFLDVFSYVLCFLLLSLLMCFYYHFIVFAILYLLLLYIYRDVRVLLVQLNSQSIKWQMTGVQQIRNTVHRVSKKTVPVLFCE